MREHLPANPTILKNFVRPRTKASDWCGVVTLIDKYCVVTLIDKLDIFTLAIKEQDQNDGRCCGTFRIECCGARFYTETRAKKGNAPSV